MVKVMIGGGEASPQSCATGTIRVECGYTGIVQRLTHGDAGLYTTSLPWWVPLPSPLSLLSTPQRNDDSEFQVSGFHSEWLSCAVMGRGGSGIIRVNISVICLPSSELRSWTLAKAMEEMMVNIDQFPMYVTRGNNSPPTLFYTMTCHLTLG